MVSKFRRIACVCLMSVMTVSFSVGSALAVSDSGLKDLTEATLSGTSAGLLDTVRFENVTGQVDLTSVALQNLSPQVIENAFGSSSAYGNRTQTVIVSLEEDSVLEATSKYVSASDYIVTAAGKRTLKTIEQSQTDFLNALSCTGIDYTYVGSYNTVVNAVAIEVNTAFLSLIKSLPSVEHVVVSETYAAPQTAEAADGAQTNPSNVYATGIYDSSDVLAAYDGSGMTVAILDTGLDYTHPAFSVMPETLGMTKSDLAEKLSSESFQAVLRSATKGEKITANNLYINDKVPFAYDYADNDTDVYPSYSNHGTHVAGIIAGQDTSYTDKDGNTAKDEEGNVIPFIGVAPNAQLVICKVFTDDLESKDLGGARSEDIIAALDDCVKLGVDVINMSLGTACGFSSVVIDGDTEGALLNDIYGRIEAAGISLVVAASNEYSSGFGGNFGTNLASNPDSGTIGSPSTFNGALSVASINGQLSPFMIANGSSPVFYLESNNENSVPYDFAADMLGDKTSETYKYVVVPGIGQVSDYTPSVRALLADKAEGEKVIAVVKRGTTSFQEKVETAMMMGADAIIVYNNVAGTVRMSLGDVEDPIPAVSVTMEAGYALTYDVNGSAIKSGTIEVNKTYLAGPFMNDYSSWGVTSDLQLKPDITAHGGEITSTVPGGYAEMSGTSMASPNMAGVIALVRAYLVDRFPSYTAVEIAELINQIVMSTATTVYDEDGLPYSPRKQGSGLATISNIFETAAYLYTDESDGGTDGNRPKVELGEDEAKSGVYTLKFYVRNFGEQSLQFRTQSVFMTESLASDGLAVAEQAHLLTDIPAVWKVGNTIYSDGDTISVAAGASLPVEVTVTLSDAEKKYIDTCFVNGMFVEGFLKLVSETDGQCDLNLSFMGFYGDWEAAPMLDYNCFEIAAFEQDASYTDETRPQASIWATQAYAAYYNQSYYVPMGGFVYLQDESADQIYTDIEHAAISHYNEFYGDNETSNYMTTTGVAALYAGLLRNAELVTYDLYNAETGEIVKQDSVYRVGKAYAGGGSAVPAQILLELTPDELGLTANGKYQIDFKFYFKATDKDDPEKDNGENTFSMIFYVDYEAPVLVDSRIRYYDYKENNKDKQRVYLDLDIYDNHYAQSVMLCYPQQKSGSTDLELILATEYVTPVYNANKNGLTTVSIEITDFYEEYQNQLYVQLDDYALNHNIYSISFSSSSASAQPEIFEVDGPTEITIGVNETYKISLLYEGSASLSNFVWTSAKESVAKVRNGEVFGVKPGSTTITIATKYDSKTVNVTVVDSTTALTLPSISFGVIKNADDNLVKAQGMVEVNAADVFTLEIVADPWYYPVNTLTIRWASLNEKIATVDQNGTVTVGSERGTATITATIVKDGVETAYAATVMLSVREPFTVSNYTLTAYHGPGGVVVLPDDKNIMYIGEDAFKDNDTITSIILPKTLTQIQARAFQNCKSLESVYFIQDTPMEIADADLTSILKNAFEGCTSLRLVDLSNVKTITVANRAFCGCTSLEEVIDMDKIGTMYDEAFYGCTSLRSADISGLHTCGTRVFYGCTLLQSVTTDFYTALGMFMFYNCPSLTSVEINTPNVAPFAFANNIALTTVSFGSSATGAIIGAQAFYGCISLTSVEFNDCTVASIGDMAFAGCSSLRTFTLPAGTVSFGDRVFYQASVSVEIPAGGDYTKDEYGAIYREDELFLAPAVIEADFAIAEGTTSIAAYAFSNSKLSTGVTTVTLPATVAVIGEGAFSSLNLQTFVLPESLAVIPDYAFSGCSSLTAIVVPDSVTQIGEEAFSGATALITVTFGADSALTSIGDFAFAGCSALTKIVLPDGAAEMGSYVFMDCTLLSEVTLPSVGTLGSYTFYNTPALTRAVFGATASTVGEWTFYNGLSDSALTSVTIGGETQSIGEGAFAFCTSLAGIDLRNVTAIGDFAFAGCTALRTVTGLENVVTVGNYAFRNCNSLTMLNLRNAETIGDSAFETDEGIYTVINIPNVREIGDFAFSGGAETTATLPATLVSLGKGAFAASANLTSVIVNADNDTFFSEGGVVYRRVNDFVTGAVSYELCSYPTNKTAASYTVKEGTVSIQAYAFVALNPNVLKSVVIPYSVKVIGEGAFYASGISEYTFECIAAPTLLIADDGPLVDGFYSLYATVFEDEFILHTNLIGTPVASTLKINYPSNGTGYDNYIYSNYFGTKVLLGELMDDTTRSLKNTIEGMVSANTVKGWLSLAVNAENTAMVTAFSNTVKSAHALYNTITSPTQLDYLGTDNVAKLTEIESELKAVKERFGIAVKATSLKIAVDSAHKTAYTEGEAFDMTGLKLTVIYDDYSSETIDASAVKLNSAYAGALTTLNRYVVLEAYGLRVQAAITVTAAEPETPDPVTPPEEEKPIEDEPEEPVPSSGCGGCNGTLDAGTGAVAALILLIAVGGYVACRKFRKNGKEDK